MLSIEKRAEKAKRLRNESKVLLETLQTKATEIGLSLPNPPNLLDLHGELLAHPNCDAAVMGAAKGGKSLIVSALQRKARNQVTATLEDSATAHIVRLRSAQSATYCLRLKDGTTIKNGSTEAITQDDLQTYGVQGATNADEIREDIAWIEVGVENSPRPEWLSLYDTQGLGAVHAAHARRVLEVVPLFEAIIFVIDSDDPIGDGELEFLDFLINTLGKRHLFFIQNKIDECGDNWQAINERSAECINERFGAVIGEQRVWPVSAVQMERYIESGCQREAFFVDSRFEAMEEALDAFLFEVCHYHQIATAISAGEIYFAECFNALSDRAKALATSQAARDRRNEIAQKKAEFQRDWVAPATEKNGLLTDIRSAISTAKETFKKKLSATEKLETDQNKKIDELTTMDGIETRAARIADEISAEAMKALLEVTESGWTQCEKSLKKFLDDVNPLSPDDKNESKPDSPHKSQPTPEFDHWAALKSGYWNAIASGGMAGWVGIGCKAFLATAWINPLIGLTSAVATVAGFFFGLKTGKEQNISKGKTELKAYATHVRQSVTNFYLYPDNTADPPRLQAPIDAHFDEIDQGLTDRVGEIAAKKLADLAREEKEATDFISLDKKGRDKKKAETLEQLESLKKFQTDLAACRVRLNELRTQQ